MILWVTNLGFVILGWALNIYIWGEFSAMGVAMLHCHVSTVAQNGQTALVKTWFWFNLFLAFWAKNARKELRPICDTFAVVYELRHTHMHTLRRCTISVGEALPSLGHQNPPEAKLSFIQPHTAWRDTGRVLEEWPSPGRDINNNRWQDRASHIHTLWGYIRI